MNDPLPMRRGQRRGQLLAEEDRLRLGEHVVLQDLAQRAALQVLHDEIDGAVGELAVFVDVDDAGVVDDVDGAGLVAEAGCHLGRAGDVGMQDLDRCAAVQLLVHCLEDLAHSALAEDAHDLIAADVLTDHLRIGSCPSGPFRPHLPRESGGTECR